MLAAENAAAVRGEVKGVVSSWVGVVAWRGAAEIFPEINIFKPHHRVGLWTRE